MAKRENLKTKEERRKERDEEEQRLREQEEQRLQKKEERRLKAEQRLKAEEQRRIKDQEEQILKEARYSSELFLKFYSGYFHRLHVLADNTDVNITTRRTPSLGFKNKEFL